MENLTIKINKTKEVLTELTLPKFFKFKRNYYYKFITDKAYMLVQYYVGDIETIEALELYPSIRIDPTRYLSYQLNENNIKDIQEITEEEFNNNLKACKKLMDNL